MDKKIFTVEHQYQLYLERSGVKESQLGPVQAQEMRRAFYGAFGQVLLLLRDEVSPFAEEEGTKILQDMLNETLNFWLKEKNQQN